MIVEVKWISNFCWEALTEHALEHITITNQATSYPFAQTSEERYAVWSPAEIDPNLQIHLEQKFTSLVSGSRLFQIFLTAIAIKSILYDMNFFFLVVETI